MNVVGWIIGLFLWVSLLSYFFKSSLLLLDKGQFFLLIFVQMTPLRGFRRKKANESRCRDIMASLKTVNSVCIMYRTKQQHYQQRWLPSLYCCCYSVTFAITWLQNDHAYQIVIFSWQTPVSWSTFFFFTPPLLTFFHFFLFNKKN